MACDVLTGKRQAPGGVIYEDQVVKQIRVELQQRMLT